MKDSAGTLDWVFQIEEKTWASAEDVGNLVEAIVAIFGRGCRAAASTGRSTRGMCFRSGSARRAEPTARG
jgi:hypothetical protein